MWLWNWLLRICYSWITRLLWIRARSHWRCTGIGNRKGTGACFKYQCVAVCCSVLQCVAVCCSVLWCLFWHIVEGALVLVWGGEKVRVTILFWRASVHMYLYIYASDIREWKEADLRELIARDHSLLAWVYICITIYASVYMQLIFAGERRRSCANSLRETSVLR